MKTKIAVRYAGVALGAGALVYVAALVAFGNALRRVELTLNDGEDENEYVYVDGDDLDDDDVATDDDDDDELDDDADARD